MAPAMPLYSSFGIIALTLLMTMTGCKNEKETQYRGCFENDDAVSLKDVIDIYDKYASAKGDSTDFDLFAAFYGQDAADSVLKLEIVGDTAFALQLPEYAAKSANMSCLRTFSVWGTDTASRLFLTDNWSSFYCHTIRLGAKPTNSFQFLQNWKELNGSNGLSKAAAVPKLDRGASPRAISCTHTALPQVRQPSSLYLLACRYLPGACSSSSPSRSERNSNASSEAGKLHSANRPLRMLIFVAVLLSVQT